MTRLAVGHLEPAFVALGRALLAALCGALYLWFSKAKIPARAEFGRLILTSLGVVLGFPFFTTWAMRDLPAAHGAVVAAAIGYAEGAKLSRLLGGLGVISWALVVAAPVLLIPFGLEVARHPPAAWLSFLYVNLISQFLGFMV